MAEFRCIFFAVDCVRTAYCWFSSLLEAAVLFSLCLRQESLDSTRSSCSEENVCLKLSSRLESPTCKDSSESYCDSEMLTPVKINSTGGTATKQYCVQVFAVLTCALAIHLLRNKSGAISSGDLLEDCNFTTEKTGFSMEFDFQPHYMYKLVKKAKYAYPAWQVYNKVQVPRVPLCGAELVLLSALARKHIVVACCHLLMGAGVSSYPFTGGYNPEQDRTESMVLHVPLYGSPNKGYCGLISVGVQNSQQVCVLIDTGSYNLAIAAAPQQNQASYFDTNHIDSNFHNLGTTVSVKYSVGKWTGVLARDKISIIDSKNTTAPLDVEFALIETSENFFISGAQWEGILGMAYPSLAKPDSSIKSYWDVLREYYGMKDIFAIKICPPKVPSSLSTSDEQGGELMLGSYDGLYSGSVFYTSIVKEDYYSVLITSINVADIPVSISCSEFNKDRTIVDSGTTDIHLAEKAYKAVLATILQYFKELPNFQIPDTFWTGESKLAWPSNDLGFIYTGFPTLYVGFASDKNESQEFFLGITPQIYLRQVEGSLEERKSPLCVSKCTFFIFGIKSRKEGSVIGGNAMLGFATIFDRESQRIGFALSTCQYQDYSEGSVPHIVGPYFRVDAEDCSCHDCTMNFWWTYVSICCVCLTVCCITTIIISIKLKKERRCIRVLASVQSCCRRRKYRALQQKNTVPENNCDDEESSSLHDLSLSSQRRRPLRVISFTIMIKKLRNILRKGHHHYSSVEASEESINLIGISYMEEYSQPIEESSFDGNILIGLDNRTIFMGKCKLSGSDSTISLHCQGTLDDSCVDLHMPKQPMMEDHITTPSNTIERDSNAKQSIQQPISEAMSPSTISISEEFSDEQADLSAVHQETVKSSTLPQQSMLEIDYRSKSTSQYLAAVGVLQEYQDRPHRHTKQHTCLHRDTPSIGSHSHLPLQGTCHIVNCTPPIQDGRTGNRSSEITSVVKIEKSFFIFISAESHKEAASCIAICEGEDTENSDILSCAAIPPKAIDNTESRLEAIGNEFETSDADNQTEDTSSKADIYEGYPKLALAVTASSILEETNNKEEPSDGSPHCSSGSSTIPLELHSKCDVDKAPLEEFNPPDGKEEILSDNKNEQRLNEGKQSHNMSRNNTNFKRCSCRTSQKKNDRKTEETSINEDEQYNQNFHNNHSQ